VETAAQLEFLMRWQCDEVQGFLFSRAVPADECAALVADGGCFGPIIGAAQEPPR
jgi:EAL domain-containing protein (putative c-di-GMP-specific phosphodiesterase class I)